MEPLKTTIKGVLPNIVGFIVLLITLRLLNVTSFIGLAGVLGVFAIGVNLYKLFIRKDKVVWWFAVLDYGRGLLSLYIIIGLFHWSAIYGYAGFVVVVLLYSVWRLFGTKKKRGVYMNAIKSMEIAIWGKSLDKENWKPGELKSLKYKFKGGKKSERNKKVSNDAKVS